MYILMRCTLKYNEGITTMSISRIYTIFGIIAIKSSAKYVTKRKSEVIAFAIISLILYPEVELS